MKILYLDDYHFLHATIKKICHNHSHLVDVVSTAKQAERFLKLNFYDVIIIDVNSDFGAAEDFLIELRATNKEIPILVATAKADRDLKLRLLEQMVDDYLIKPFDWDELMVRVKVACRRLGPAHQEYDWLDYGLIKLNEEGHRVLVNGQDLKLRHKEFLILQYFLENMGVIITREELLEKFWDSNADLFSNAVNVHLYNLRRKMKTKLPEECQLIKTVPRKGFRFLLPQVLV